MAEETPSPLDCSSNESSGAGAATVVDMEIVTEVEVRDGPAPDESEVVTDVEVVVLHEQPELLLTLEPMLPPGVAPPAALCSAMSGPAGASTADQPQRHSAALMACPEELPVAAAPPAPPPMVAEEALRQAEAEGLTLLKSESSNTGYKGVTFMSSQSCC